MFGYTSDIERSDVLYTSLLVQMWQGLAATPLPDRVQNARAWRRSWLLGFVTAVVARVRAAEESAARQAAGPAAGATSRTALVLADRTEVIARTLKHAYPVTRTSRVTYTGNGYGTGYSEGQRADIGASRLRTRAGRSLTAGR